MTLEMIALYGFIAVVGTLASGFAISQIVHMFNDRNSNEAFRTAIDMMSKSTVVAVESIKDTTVTSINAILNMDALRDVNALARDKAKEQNGQAQAGQNK